MECLLDNIFCRFTGSVPTLSLVRAQSEPALGPVWALAGHNGHARAKPVWAPAGAAIWDVTVGRK